MPGRPLIRIEPSLPVGAMKSYTVISPADTSVVVACQVAGCQAYKHGWETTVDERSELGMQQATYIRQGSGRTFTERKTGDGRTVFRFEAFQRCFAEHKTRPERYIERGGDWRGNPRGDVVRHNPDTWTESFGEHQQKLADRLERG
jgi:hypothetical protein